MSGINVLLSRLQGTRRTGNRRWIARCPAHEDRNASLSIRELEDGLVLFHCFAGCKAEAVLQGAGLTWSDVLPAEPTAHRTPERAPFHALDVLRALEHEALIVASVVATVGMGSAPSEDDQQRVSLAHARILAGLRLAGGGR